MLNKTLLIAKELYQLLCHVGLSNSHSIAKCSYICRDHYLDGWPFIREFSYALLFSRQEFNYSFLKRLLINGNNQIINKWLLTITREIINKYHDITRELKLLLWHMVFIIRWMIDCRISPNIHCFIYMIQSSISNSE